MKNLDLISKRILVISLSISAVLLSASLLIFSVRPANAQTPSISSRMDDGRRYDAVASGSSNSAIGFLIWNTQTGTYRYITGIATMYYREDSNGVIGNSSEKFW